MSELICPYPGLRPFNDDEAIFFKGRDKNITSIIELFEKKKFMMLTGASGDGKSSLVYAGVVPNARAGLFKAKYNSWAIADFRPERTPLKNLTKALIPFFNFEEGELEKKLSYGFSSLVNIYKSSDLYIETTKEEWLTADDAKKKQLKRKASNLLIIADQFEEFFTNTENYFNGVASVESQTVVNILLETAKIALAEDLPIYIICTMRSDYIGQCAAFRGLPEYIGFSHFFVPRLKRNEISEVIEQPAVFNGDKISRRLSERLLNDITDGHDQLPILQHALNQIWKMAGSVGGEMDLIHYAMVGGLNKNQLQPDDQSRLELWLENVPEFKKRLFESASLENILNAHADELLETAYDKYTEKHSVSANQVTKEETFVIIKKTFQCLTKIDDARAVRNRMSLKEIADIINHPHIKAEDIGKVLDIFREQGNTFIKPFITDDPATLKTKSETVLDITHESLIRNWGILQVWANEEYNNLLTWQDFNKQLQRWVTNGKKKGYLLPIGPLTFFEDWYNKAKPNKYWLARYDEREISYEEKVEQAEENLINTRQFLKKSGNALFFSRTVIKYGANTLATWFGIVALIGVCAFYYFDYRTKQNDAVIERIVERGIELLKSNKVKLTPKAHFVINYERLNNGSFEKLIDKHVSDDSIAFEIVNKMFFQVENFTKGPKKDTVNPLIYRLVGYMDLVLGKILKTRNVKNVNDGDLNRMNKIAKACFLISNHNHSNKQIEEIFKRNYTRLQNSISQTLNSHPDSIKPASSSFNESFQLLFSLNSNEHLKNIYNIVKIAAPFGKDESVKRFKKLFPKDVYWNTQSNQLADNGGYQLFAYAYASIGDIEKTIHCVDSLTAANKEYKSQYAHGLYSILACLLKYNSGVSVSEVRDIIKKYCQNTSASYLTEVEKITNLLGNGKIDSWEIKTQASDLFPFSVSGEQREAAWKVYWELKKVGIVGDDEFNFQYALFLKKYGIYESNYDNLHNDSIISKFNKAFNYFSRVSDKFLLKDSLIGTPENNKSIKYSSLFLFPGIINGFDKWDPYYQYNGIYPFADFIVKNNLSQYYNNEVNFEDFRLFIYAYYESKMSIYSEESLEDMDYVYFDFLKGIIKDYKTDLIDRNFLGLVEITRAFQKGDSLGAMKGILSLDEKRILSAGFQYANRTTASVHQFLIASISEQLCYMEKNEIAFRYLFSFEKPYQRRNAIIKVINNVQKSGFEEKMYPLLDTLMRVVDEVNKYDTQLLNILGKIGSQEVFDISNRLIKDIDSQSKQRALAQFISGLASVGYYYQAHSYVPSQIASNDEMGLLNQILHAEAFNSSKDKGRQWNHVDLKSGEYNHSWLDSESEGVYRVSLDE